MLPAKCPVAPQVVSVSGEKLRTEGVKGDTTAPVLPIARQQSVCGFW
jgi:hypothetical protein